jgi:hypothetical protein
MTNTNAQLEFQKTGTWYDYFGQKSLNIDVTSQSILLAPGEYKLYSTLTLGLVITGIENDFNDPGDLLIYPNPTSSFINVTSTEGIKRVSIFTLAGLKAKEFILTNTQGVENQLYIGDLPSGIYLLQTKNMDGQVVVRKIIKRP